MPKTSPKPLPEITQEILTQFWRQVEKGPDCWNWIGAISPKGYGVLTIAQSVYLAHRISWIIHHESDPRPLFVLHKCDNRKCVNAIDHLFIGTVSDNSHDASKKGRLWHKLSAEQVIEIRIAYQNGAIAYHLAKRYGVDHRTIKHIVTRKHWKHI